MNLRGWREGRKERKEKRKGEKKGRRNKIKIVDESRNSR